MDRRRHGQTKERKDAAAATHTHTHTHARTHQTVKQLPSPDPTPIARRRARIVATSGSDSAAFAVRRRLPQSAIAAEDRSDGSASHSSSSTIRPHSTRTSCGRSRASSASRCTLDEVDETDGTAPARTCSGVPERVREAAPPERLGKEERALLLAVALVLRAVAVVAERRDSRRPSASSCVHVRERGS
eukprot:1619170-Pleurochrysis_carterae.AAC.1